MESRTIKASLIILIALLLVLPLTYFFLQFIPQRIDYQVLIFLYEFVKFVYNKRILKVFAKTFFLGVSVSLFSLIVGFIPAYFLEFRSFRLKNFIRASLFIPFLIPPYLFVFSWLGFLGKRGLFSQIHFLNLSIDIYNPLALIFFLSLSFFPVSMLFISLGFRNITKKILNPIKIFNEKGFWKITLLLLKPYLLISFFVTLSLFFSEYIVPSYLRINTYQSEIFVQLATFYDVRKASFLTLPLVIFSLIVAILSFKVCKIKTEIPDKKFVPPHLIRREKVFFYSFTVIVLVLSLIIPLSVFLAESKLDVLNPLLETKGIFFTSVLFSTLISFSTTFLSNVILFYLRSSQKFVNFLLFFTLLMPTPVLGVVLTTFFSAIKLNGTVLPLIDGYVIKFLPFSLLFMMPEYGKVTKSLESSIRIFSRGSLISFFKIVLPIVKEGFFFSLITIFILCFGEASLAQLLLPPGLQTISLRMETLLHYGNYQAVASLSLSTVFIPLALYSLYALFKGVKR
ncbi:MAG: iron ABC transporter permease [Candidatus Aenigmarchaeota archaeon]|nr:iron ABC transporter permease [Candidatus Aenigmarchaeota archaeon]